MYAPMIRAQLPKNAWLRDSEEKIFDRELAVLGRALLQVGHSLVELRHS